MVYRSTRRCPGCDHELQTERRRSYSLERCAGCTGIWLGLDALELMLRDMVPGNWPGMPQFEPAVVATKDRRCPDCQQLMARGAILGIVIDHCDGLAHGVWFDRSELAPILERMVEVAPNEYPGTDPLGDALRAELD